jgi:Putative prokaryotic signal transducing protein
MACKVPCMPAWKVSDRDAPTEVLRGHGPLRVCARCANPLDAQVLAACLQNRGLAPRVMDSDTIHANGALFSSLPFGGVRVMVPESQLEDALRICAAFDAGELAIDEDFDVGNS